MSVLARVESDLLHMNVLLRVLPQSRADVVLIVDRLVSQDPLWREAMEEVCAGGLQTRAVSPSDAKALLEGELAGQRVLVLFRSCRTALEAHAAGFPFAWLRLGHVRSPEGRRVSKAVWLSADDEACLNRLRAAGVLVEW